MSKPKRITGNKKITIKKAVKPNYKVVKTTFYKNGKAVSIRKDTQTENGTVNPAQRKTSISKSTASQKRALKKPSVSKQPAKYTATIDVSFKMALVAKRKAAKRILRAKAKKLATNTAKSVGKKAAKAVLVKAPTSIAKAKIQAKRKAAEIMISQGLQSTGFGNDTSSSPNAQAAETFSRGFKDTSERIITEFKHAPKKLVRGVKRTPKSIKAVKKSINGVTQAAKGMNQAVKNFQRAQHINSVLAKGTRQATTNTVKNTVRLTVELVKQTAIMLVNITKGLVEGIASFGWVAIVIVAVLVIILGLSAIFFSEYGIFLSNDSGSSLTIQDVIKEVNADYQAKVNDKINDLDDSDVYLIRHEGNRTQWKNIIAIYAVKYASDEGNVITVDNHTLSKLKSIFYKFHSIRGFYSFEPSPYDSSRTWKVLVIQTNTATPEEVMDEYHFTEDQRKRVDEIITSQPDNLWDELIYGTSGRDTSFFLEVAKQQLGQHRQLYTAWYGESSIGAEEWSGCFVSWCANEAGFITKGCYPKFNNLNDGVNWFKSKGLWENPNETPNVGDTIFLDWNSDGNCDRCGIVSDIKDGKIFYIGADVSGNEDVAEFIADFPNPNNFIMGFGKLSLTP